MSSVLYISCDFCGKSVPMSQSGDWLVKVSVYKMRYGSKSQATKVLDNNDYCEQACQEADLSSKLSNKSNQKGAK